VYGEKAGVMGDSCGYDRHVLLRSPGFEAELGLGSADIQFVIGWVAKSNVLPVDDALEGTLMDLVSCASRHFPP
jgi:hypothetical protein